MAPSAAPSAAGPQRRGVGTVPGPRQRHIGEFALSIIRRPLDFFDRLKREYGDLAGFHIGKQPIVLVSDPELIRDVLVTHGRLFVKGRTLERAKSLLGEGLLTSEGDVHLRQRRLVQPAFHRSRIAAYAETMSAYAEQRAGRWRDGQQLDVSREMAAYTLAVVGRTLFDADIEGEAPEIGEALTAAIDAFNLSVLPFFELLERLPLPTTLRFRRGRDRLDATIYRLIAERRASGEDRGDLLSMLLLAHDTEGDGTGMSDRQLRDEAMTLLLAGHETTANLLAWSWYLLSLHPEAEARLHAEVDAVRGERLGADDLAQLPFTRAVLAESMRLYPTAWMLGRRVTVPYRIGEHELPKDTVLLMGQWIVHRDSRWWPEADQFRPERWMPGGSALDPARPKFAYFPFGAGTRVCIGEQFAWLEGTLAMATMARRWRLRLVPGTTVKPQAIITLRVRGGLPMTAHAR